MFGPTMKNLDGSSRDSSSDLQLEAQRAAPRRGATLPCFAVALVVGFESEVDPMVPLACAPNSESLQNLVAQLTTFQKGAHSSEPF